MPSPSFKPGSVQMGITAPSTIQPSPVLTGPVRQSVVVDDSFNRLKLRAVSGEIATPSGTGACDMRSTATRSGASLAPRRSSFPPLCSSTTTGRGRSTPHRCQGRVSGSQPRRPPAPTASVSPTTSDYPYRVTSDRHRVPLFNTEISPECAGRPNGAAAIHLKLTLIAIRPP